MKRLGRLLGASALVLALGACASAVPPPVDPLTAARSAGPASTDGELVGTWLLDELLAPGGDAAGARKARARLDAIPGAKGMYASLAKAIDDDAHGRFKAAASAYVDALAAARTDEGPDAPLVAWFSANHLVRLRSSVQGLWEHARPLVERALDEPGRIGWRARGELVEWWRADGLAAADEASLGGVSRIDAAARRHGCVARARIAGPFGHGSTTDARVRFPAEAPGPWPRTFPADARRLEPPRVLPVDRYGCQLQAVGAPFGGVFYVETFVDLPAEREVVIAVQGALAILVDDVEVLGRDTAQWGIWPRFGAHVRLAAGRHRVLARVGGPETSIRLLTPSGLPLDAPASDDPAPPYAALPPQPMADPNVLTPFLAALGVPGQKGAPPPLARDVAAPSSRFLAAYLAQVEGQSDVSSVLLEPLVKDAGRATGTALATQAIYTEKDPIFPGGDARDLARGLRESALAKDPGLWWPALWLLLDEADKKGLPEILPKLAELADRFREVPDIVKGLAGMYSRLGWKPERARAVKQAAERFPDDTEALGALLDLYDEQGLTAEADAIAARIRKLDPDAEIELQRSIARRDYRAAIAELKRLGERRKDRKDIAARISDLLARAGQSSESMDKLERAVEADPTDAGARLALADARFAAGDRGALRRALVDSIQKGSDTAALRDAIELVDGMTELTPFRQDSRKVIAAFEASGESMPGNAARVLDYSAMWIHADGTARMLEHEIIHIQSREAIQELAEQRVPSGLILRLRTLKKDGRVLEPEIVEGKPTVTMPHLEVGDYIETENVTSFRGDGLGGRAFEGPRWYFREEKLAYWRSEFIVVSPKNRPLVVETTGDVPAPAITESGALITRRWRVDKSPALPEEPGSAPIQEFLPSVRIGWGVNLDDTVARMIDAVSDETPRDPRLVRIARSIVDETIAPPPPAAAKDTTEAKEKVATAASGAAPRACSAPAACSVDERARRIYRWVLANVEAGREDDPRRVVIGKSGNRTEAFLYLCRVSGIDAQLGIVQDRLTPPSRGPLSEAGSFDSLAVRLATSHGPRWLVVNDKYAPYGYLPSPLRGQPAIVLRPGAPRETTSSEGSKDGIVSDGTVELATDGSARLTLEQSYEGKYAIGLRTALETIPDARLKDIVETKLLQSSLPGARLMKLDVKKLALLDEPLTLSMTIEMSSFARARGDDLVISPPFPVDVAGLASLPSRETPLYLSEGVATRSVVRLRIGLPRGASVTTALAPVLAEDGGRTVAVRDRVEGGALFLDRTIDIPAGRVPVDAYPAFQAFARDAEAALQRDVVVSLAGAAK